MSILDQSYRRWQGRPTPHWWRVLVVPRYALSDLFRLKKSLVLSAACLLPPIALAAWVYVAANAEVLRRLIPSLQVRIDVLPGATSFAYFFGMQTFLAILFVLYAAPRLFANDIAGGAMPLYLSKSLRRTDYALGKCLVLFAVVSGASWLPLLLVAGLRAALVDAERAAPGGGPEGVASGIVVAGLGFAVVLTLLSAAIAVHVRRAWLAPFLIFLVLVVTGPVARLVAELTGSALPFLAAPLPLFEALRDQALGTPGGGSMLPELGVGAVAFGLAAWAVGSGVVLLRGIRPVDVVR